ncbi:MAG: GNAT family N-acetyltransferase [Bacteroidota bacterium]
MPEIRILTSADSALGADIHRVMLLSFEVFRKDYTPGSFSATVLSPELIADRIRKGEATVMAAFEGKQLVGTAALKEAEGNSFYLCTMGADPAWHGRGIGYALLKKAEKLALERKKDFIGLETNRVLTRAIALYKKFGFRETGRSRDFFGVTIFEMRKDL